MLEPHFPLGANLVAVFIVFVVLLVALDIILVRWLKLGKTAWKRVEYIWLGFATLGVFGAVAQVREITANAQLAIFQDRATSAFQSFRSLVDSYASEPGTVCRTFIRSEYSPPPDEFDRTQSEYKQACEWVKLVAQTIPSQLPTPAKSFSPSSLPARPPDSSSADLKDIIDGLYSQLDFYNREYAIFADLLKKADRTSFEEALIYLGPFLLVIALAIRITKVTGEIQLKS